MKRIICFGLMLIMVFCLAACNMGLEHQVIDLTDKIEEQDKKIEDLENDNRALAKDIEDLQLELYKFTQKTDLKDYVAQLDKNNYIKEDWTIISGIVAEGKADIDKAADKAGVDGALSSAIAAIDKLGVVFIERWDQDWVSNKWDGKVEVTLDFPREVKQGELFSITVTTKNISGADVEYITCSCCARRGVTISKIMLHSTEIELYVGSDFSQSIHNDDDFFATISKGQTMEFTWIFIPYGYIDGGYVEIPKGFYDIYLRSGEVYRNAITVI